ncbi:LOW QUALITY PROTEIN: bcl-2/adenovirus E1B 19 kDa-interacting protein 2-like protein [Morphnus guianensis]
MRSQAGTVTHVVQGLNFPFSSTFGSRLFFRDGSCDALLTLGAEHGPRPHRRYPGGQTPSFPGVQTPLPILPRVRGAFWGSVAWMGGGGSMPNPQIQPSREETGCATTSPGLCRLMRPNQFGAISAITGALHWWGATEERLPGEVTGTRMAVVMATGDSLDLSEEWQDEDFPGPLPEGCLGAGSAPRHMRRRLPALEWTESTERSPDASIDIDLDALETPSGSDGFEWEEELLHTWSFAKGAGSQRVPDTEDKQPVESVDLSAVEPYSGVLSHGRYHGEGFGAMLLFAACHLPDSSIPRYSYVMENLLRYIVGTLERTVADRYILVCLSGAAARGQIPSFGWMKRCYQAMDRWLRKSLQAVIIVHPTWYIKALVMLSRPFLSPTFSGKVRFAASLRELSQLVPLELAHVPEPVRQLEPSWDGSRDVIR